MKGKKRKSRYTTRYKTSRSDFICTECFNVMSLNQERHDQIGKYQTRIEYCTECKKKTINMCMGNFDMTAKELEFITCKTKKEAKAYSLIKKYNERKK